MSIEVRLNKILVPSPAQTKRAPVAVNGSGKVLPSREPTGKPGGTIVPVRAIAKQPPAPTRVEDDREIAALASRTAHYLRESGRPISFRVQSSAGRTVIQEVNPDTGEVIAELTSDQLLSLAHGLGLSGSLVDEHA